MEELVSSARVEAVARVEVMVAGWVPRVDKLVRTTEDLEGGEVEELVSSARVEAARVEVMMAGWALRWTSWYERRRTWWRQGQRRRGWR